MITRNGKIPIAFWTCLLTCQGHGDLAPGIDRATGSPAGPGLLPREAASYGMSGTGGVLVPP
jgi:hypothetical protein